jgi:hypothetical protein
MASKGDCAFFHNTVVVGREAAGATYFPNRKDVLDLDGVWGLSKLNEDEGVCVPLDGQGTLFQTAAPAHSQ